MVPTVLDLVCVALFAVALPVWDYLVSWPAFHRMSKEDPPRARKRLWLTCIVFSWPVVIAGAVLWMSHGRPWPLVGFSVPVGWRLWVSAALVLLLALYVVYAVSAVSRDAQAKETVRKQFTGAIADTMPHTKIEMGWFAAVSLTVAFYEEFLFRGYIIWVLSPWLGWWGAAALSVVVFAIGHAYQGWNGVLKTGVVGVVYTVVVAVFVSLWPAILLHFLWDLSMGILAWLVLREGSVTDEVREAETQA